MTNFKRKLLSGGGGSGGGSTIQCSSTPRKSKAHIDQRRLLDQIMSTASPSGPEFSPDCIVKPAVNLPSSLKKLELNRRMSLFKWRQPKLTYASDSGNSDVMNSPQIKNIRYGSGSGSGSGSKKRSKRSKDRRGSIYFRGSMFARNCRTPTTGFREVFKKKSKVQRNAIFNKYRHEVLNEMLIKKASLCPDNWDEFCSNNNNEEFFLKDFKMNKHSNEDDGNSCGEDDEDDGNYNKSSKHFQQLLEAKESHAPFEISEINSNPSCYNINNSSSNVHSRTIYGASVILNRKIPNVSTTMVRKSSIYVKGVDGKSVILVTNQTITLKDLAQMWLQMNISAKSFIALILTATFIGIISVVINFLYR